MILFHGTLVFLFRKAIKKYTYDEICTHANYINKILNLLINQSFILKFLYIFILICIFINLTSIQN